MQNTLFSAEFGRGLGVINYTLRSGTNRFHGGLFEFLRNDKLDARPFFSAMRPITRLNEYGGNIGGPVLIPKIYNGKDRTFFNLNYTCLRNRPPISGSLARLPTTEFRQGNFANHTDNTGVMIPIFDPNTTTCPTPERATGLAPWPSSPPADNSWITTTVASRRASDSASRFVLDVAYVGQRGLRLPSGLEDINQQINGIQRYSSGVPISVTGGGAIPLFNGGNRPSIVSGVAVRTNVSGAEFDPAIRRYLDAAAFTQPAPFTFGNAPPALRYVRNFGQMNEDLSLLKSFRIREEHHLQFRAEFFNIFNRVIFGGPSANLNSLANFGRISGQSNSSRKIQFGLKYAF